MANVCDGETLETYISRDERACFPLSGTRAGPGVRAPGVLVHLAVGGLQLVGPRADADRAVSVRGRGHYLLVVDGHYLLVLDGRGPKTRKARRHGVGVVGLWYGDGHGLMLKTGGEGSTQTSDVKTATTISGSRTIAGPRSTFPPTLLMQTVSSILFRYRIYIITRHSLCFQVTLTLTLTRTLTLSLTFPLTLPVPLP